MVQSNWKMPLVNSANFFCRTHGHPLIWASLLFVRWWRLGNASTLQRTRKSIAEFSAQYGMMWRQQFQTCIRHRPSPDSGDVSPTSCNKARIYKSCNKCRPTNRGRITDGIHCWIDRTTYWSILPSFRQVKSLFGLGKAACSHRIRIKHFRMSAQQYYVIRGSPRPKMAQSESLENGVMWVARKSGQT